MIIARSELASVLGLSGGSVVALVGGGGKTTLMWALGRSLGPSLLTTTTRMAVHRTDGLALAWGEPPAVVVGPTLVWRSQQGDKALGFAPAIVDSWVAGRRERDLSVPVVIEADGARHAPFKAPADHEPVIPLSSNVVVAVIGADALGRVIADQCFRPLRVAAVAGCSPYERLTAERAAAVLVSDRGSRKAVPSQARFCVVITKVEGPQQSLVDELLGLLTARGIDAISVADEAPDDGNVA